MPSNYPSALDDLSNPSGSQRLSAGAGGHAALHTAVNDAIEAIQATLGLNPQQGRTTVAALLSEIVSFNVKRYGAEGDWNGTTGTDDTAAIIFAATVLQAAGGGTLFFPQGSYRIFSTDYSATLPTEALVALSSLSGVRIEGPGAVLYVDRDIPLDSYVDLFRLTDCSRVEISGLRMENALATTRAAGARTRGGRMVRALEGCRDITLRDLSAVGGMGFVASALSSAVDADRTIGVKIDGFNFSYIGYGISCQFSGDNLKAKGIVSDHPHRTAIIYGVKNVDLQIVSADQDADDCIIGAFEGVGCDNVELDYTNVDSDNAESAAPCIALQYGDRTPATLRDIRLHVDVAWPAAGYFGNAILLAKYEPGNVYDTLDSPHTLSGLKLSGRFRNSAGGGIPFYVGGLWGAASTQEGIDLSDLRFEGSGNPEFVFDALRGRALVSNLEGDGVDVYLRGSADGLITVLNARANSLCASAGDTTEINYIDCEIGSAANQSFTNKRFLNSSVNGVVYNTMLSDVPAYNSPIFRLNEAGVWALRDTFVNLSTTPVAVNGGRAFGPGVVHFRLQTIDGHHGTFSVWLGLESGVSYRTVFAGGANATVTETSEGTFTIVVTGDARTYTLVIDTAASTATLVSSSLATGNTVLGFFVVNV